MLEQRVCEGQLKEEPQWSTNNGAEESSMIMFIFDTEELTEDVNTKSQRRANIKGGQQWTMLS